MIVPTKEEPSMPKLIRKKKEKEYVEGQKALKGFEKTMKALFRVTKITNKGKD